METLAPAPTVGNSFAEEQDRQQELAAMMDAADANRVFPALSEKLRLAEAECSDLRDRLMDANWRLAEAYCDIDRLKTELRDADKQNEGLAEMVESLERVQYASGMCNEI